MPHKNNEDEKKYKREWYHKNRDRILANQRSEEGRKNRAVIRKRHAEKLRLRIIKKYGNICACCKESNKRFLTIDHIHNDGGDERKRLGRMGGRNFYTWLEKQDYQPERYQVLCFNCNMGKMVNGGVCPHETKKNAVVALSGGFDPVHVGHVRMFKEAADFGRVVVILNCDDWLLRKKGKVFMSQDERKELIESIRYVDEVYIHQSDKDDVSDALKKIKPTYFGNGGDRTDKNTPEKDVCKKLGIEMLYNIGGGKVQSSSWLLDTWEKS